MDPYAKQCVEWLLENDPDALGEHVKIACGLKETPTLSTITEVERIVAAAIEKPITKKEPTAMQCPTCGKHTIAILEMQTRSADEGATVFYSCGSCLYRWKER